MTAFRSADSLDGDRPARCRYMSDFTGARLYVYARSFGTVLQIDGEIDSSNAMSVAEVIRRFARLKTPLILDLSHLDFLSIDGFRALLVLNNEHKQARVHCSVVAGNALLPLLHIVIAHGLPVVGSVAEAVQLIEDIVRAQRQLRSEMFRYRQPRHKATRIAAVPS